MEGKEYWQLSARQIVDKLKNRKVTPLELIDHIEARIQEVDLRINAIPIRCFDLARRKASRLRHPENVRPGYLYGLPILLKDSMALKGVECTSGSTIYKGYIAQENDPLVDILESNGAIVVGKTNLPEFGAGANTYNTVFGETLNPWNLQKTCGGSSGGSAAALASGQGWLATGSDLGGSLRIPASFCGVLGFRTSVGAGRLLPIIPVVSGPMARNTGDLALMLDAMVHPRVPYSLSGPNYSFQKAIENPQMKGARIAWSPDLGGIAPVDPETKDICFEAVQWFGKIDCHISEACPDIKEADHIFQVLRADAFADMDSLPERDKIQLKEELHWQINKGKNQNPSEVQAAVEASKKYQKRVHDFLKEFDFLCTPCVMCPPFDVSIRWLKKCGPKVFTNYVEWLLMTFAFSLVDVPSISVPCGLTKTGLPIGLQIIGPHKKDKEVLKLAAWYEANHKWKDLVPLDI